MDKFPLKEGGGNGLWDRLILIPPYKVALARPTPPIPTLTVEKQVPCRIRCPAMREQTHTFRTLQFSRKISGLVSSGFLAFATEIIKVFSCMNITRCSPLNFINLDLNERHFRNFLLHCAIPYAFPLRLLFKVRTSNMVSGEGEEHILTREKIVHPKKWETEKKADFEAKATRPTHSSGVCTLCPPKSKTIIIAIRRLRKRGEGGGGGGLYTLQPSLLDNNGTRRRPPQRRDEEEEETHFTLGTKKIPPPFSPFAVFVLPFTPIRNGAVSGGEISVF